MSEEMALITKDGQRKTKQRVLLVRNSLGELEMAVREKLNQGYEFDPDNKPGSLRQALKTVILENMPVTIGMYKYGFPPKTD